MRPYRELIIEAFGVDHFPIHRLTNEDDAFAIGGRFLKPNPKEKWRQHLLEVLLDAESRRNPHGARDLEYSAAPGDLLRPPIPSYLRLKIMQLAR